jgi:glutamate dehydrogenase
MVDIKKPVDIYSDQARKKMVDSLLGKINSDLLLNQFATVYLHSLTNRAILIEDESKLQKFIENRFKNFKKLVLSKEEILINITNTQNSPKLSIEIVCTDAQYLIFSLESVFNQFGLKINKLFHPLMSVIKDSKAIKSVHHSSIEGDLIALPYFECESQDTLSTPIIEKLKIDVLQRIKAVHCSRNDQIIIQNALNDAKKEVAAYPETDKDFQSEFVELIDWLKNENFSFFGYGKFSITTNKKTSTVSEIQSHQYGILTPDYLKECQPKLLPALKKQILDLATYRSPFIFDAIRINSPIKRDEKLMRLSIKTPVKAGKFIEYNFLGLLKRSSLFAKNIETPIIKLRLKKIFENKHFFKGSHNYNQTIRFCNNIPKYELFRTPTENLQKMIEDLISISSFTTCHVFSRNNIDKSKLFLLVVIPTDAYSIDTENKIIDVLKSKVPHDGLEYFSIPGDQFYRLHVYFDQNNLPNYEANTSELEEAIQSSTKSWTEILKDCLYKQYSTDKADSLFTTYQNAFPLHHQVRRTPEQTVEDIAYFEKVKENKSIQFNVMPFIYAESVLSGKASLLNIYHHEKIDLYHLIPIFRNLNLYFYDELTTRVGTVNNIIGYTHSFRVCHLDGSNLDLTKTKTVLVDLLAAIFSEKLPNDPLNGLATLATINWKKIFILQAYRNYILQLKPSYTKEQLDHALLTHYKASQLLTEYFDLKFAINQNKTAHLKQLDLIKKLFFEALNDVLDIDDDYILKWIFNVLENTLRSNYCDDLFENIPVLALKFNSSDIKMPDPKPFREIFVFGSELEGIHLRFGAVSRGGIRWSNRPNDYRSEVLGLAATQRVKNVVIVPNGSKGGFITKQNVSPENRAGESKKQYQAYINALLSITDSLNEKNKIVKPKNVVCYDNDDPYLVVAADKGTATFSDIANEISQKRQFWLDDAFASGGSHGYSHKDLGITAKGAWECVKLHFLEQNKDIQKDPFTVVGVGDMSGDVFGNGMLLSKQIKLIAAFNHIEIFIDPNPDTAISWKERKRLFDKPGSKWSDYSVELLSKGGAIYQRSAKRIRLTHEIKTLLNTDKDELNGEELIKEILKLPTELLWFAGIGTYIKSASQSHFEVADIANNSVRIDDTDCRAQVIGEGANLALTQQSRLKLSQSGIKLNTDFIDNSAGVNTSDYEVNIKLFLSTMQRQNIIKSEKERHKLLEQCTDEVIEKVLENNKNQHQLISLEVLRSKKNLSRYEAFIQSYIHNGLINPDTDPVPSQSNFDSLKESNDSLPRPLLAFLQAIVKLDLSEQLVSCSKLDAPLFNELFLSYFPQLMHKTFGDHLIKHPLKREITATLLTNYAINNAGILFFSQIKDVTHKPLSDIVVTYFMLNKLFNCDQIRRDIEKTQKDFKDRYKLFIELELLLQEALIDILLMKDNIFTIADYPNLETKFDHFNSEILPKLKNKLTTSANKSLALLEYKLPFIAFLNAKQFDKKQKEPNTKDYINCLKYFKFNEIKQQLTLVSLKSNWEVEEFMLLQKLFSQKKLSIIQSCLIHKLDNESDEDLYKQLFSEELQRFKHNLTLITHNNTPCLSSLNVLINQLNSL